MILPRCRDDARSRCGDLPVSRGFWPFTRDFEKAIDHRANSANLPRAPLHAKFGRNKSRETLAGTARTIRTLRDSEIAGVFEEARAGLLDMQKDVCRHSKDGEADARILGLSYEMLQAGQTLPLVQRLIDKTSTDDLVVFFAGALASTEFIAEAVGEMLATAPGYTRLFDRRSGDLDGGPHGSARRRAVARGHRDGLRPRLRRVGLAAAH